MSVDTKPADGQEVFVRNHRGEVRLGSYDATMGDVLFQDGFWHLNDSQAIGWSPASGGGAMKAHQAGSDF